MKCRICGTKNDDYLLYCVMCGARLPERTYPGSAPAQKDDSSHKGAPARTTPQPNHSAQHSHHTR